MRLIDADALWDEVRELADYAKEQKFPSVYNGLSMALGALNQAPTIEAEAVRHGHWIVETDGGTRCSYCKQTVKEVSSGVAVPVNLSDMPYCPKCGAKMDGTDTDVHTREVSE